MTTAGPWSVKGIDPKAREIAKDLARRSGLTLGEWLNQMIIEGGEPEPEVPAEPRRPLDDLYREAQVRRMAAETRAPDESESRRLTRALETLATRVEAAEQRSVLAISGMDQSVMGVLTRLDEIEREGGGGKLEGSVEDVRTAQARLADRLRRLEGEGGPQHDNLKALEAALGRMALRMDEEASRAEEARQQAREAAEAARHALEASRGVGHRLERLETVLEAAPGAYADAEKVEIVLTRMAERLDQTETRANAAVQSLQTSFAGLDARLRGSEARVAGHTGAEMERRFQTLAQDLSQRVEASRVELAQRIRAAADGRADKLEAALRELGGHVEQTEKRSAQAIDRIGREVLRVAHGLGERVNTAETRLSEVAEQTQGRLAAVEGRSTVAMEAMSGQVARLADTMDGRLRGADTAQAEALEKLGGEIARIAERLSERISTSDRRSAEAIDEVSDKVAKIGAGIDARQAADASALSERIRASEERTAKLLEDARERLDQRLAEVRRPAEPLPAALPASVSGSVSASMGAFEPLASPPLSNADPFLTAPPPSAAAVASTAHDLAFHDLAPLNLAPRDLAPHDFAQSGLAPGASAQEEDDRFTSADPFAREEPAAMAASAHAEPSPFDPDDDFSPSPWPAPAHEAEPFAPSPEAAPQSIFAATAFDEQLVEPQQSSPLLGFSVGDFAPAPEPSVRSEQSSTREMLDAARGAARRAAAGRVATGRRGEAGAPGSVLAPPLEPIGQASSPRGFGIGLPGWRKKETAPTLRTALLASLTAGAIGAMGGGAYLLGGSNHAEVKAAPEVAMAEPFSEAPAIHPPTAPSTPTLAMALSAPVPPPATPKVDPSEFRPISDKAAPPPPVKSARAAETPSASAPATTASTRALYASAVGRLDNGDLTALTDLKSAAEQGSASAQFYLARLYEAGAAGLSKDLPEARRWTAKAAEGGDASAMYNLASYMYAGDGGAKDVAGAAKWFRRSAEHGVVNGQYNLAQLYEKGYGVQADQAEAYKWYMIAAASGDLEAKAAAEILKAKMAPAAVASANHAAAQENAQLSGVTVKTAAAQP